MTEGTTTATGAIALTVTPVNDAPVASNLTLSTTEDTPVGFTLPASDVDGDALTFVLTSSPAVGRLSGTIPNLTYTPGRDASGTESFGFTVRDAAGATSSGTVTITTTAVDDAPVHLEVTLGDIGGADEERDGDAAVDHLAADVLPKHRVGARPAQVLEDGVAQLLQHLALLHANHLCGWG